MEKWIDEAFARACEKLERGAKRAAEQGIIPYMGQKDGYTPAPFDGNSWWTGGFWPGMMWQLYAATGRDVYKDEALLAGRFNPTGFIHAWPQADRAGYAIIDCMMNLSMLYWALDKPGGQGYAPGSSWSRGQAWALYGFTLSGINTGDSKYIDVARRCAKYFIANIREDGLTDCDFRQPKDEERIDNIAGACAACGLLELANVVGGGEAETYRAAAMKLLKALDTLCADWTDGNMGILQKCTASYHNDGAGRHVNILYGDYFFIEALCKLRGTDARLWMARK